VVTARETGDSIRRAQRALAAIRARDADDRKRDPELARSAQLNHSRQADRQADAREAEYHQALSRG
jgi:hypothetical protein